MATDKLEPDDPRVKHAKVKLPSGTYKYLLGEPKVTPPIANMVLIHGFPDLSYGWRYQVPFFVSLGFRVVVPDMLGYGETDAPADPAAYTYKKLSADIKALAAHTCGADGRIILGGHDWGGFIVFRVAMRYPELVRGVFSVCSPFNAPSASWTPLEDIIAAGHLTNFSYQLQFRGPEVEEQIQGEEKVRQFLNALYGATDSKGAHGMSVKDGVLFDVLSGLGRSPLLSEEDLDFMVEQYCRKGPPELRGPLNYYRTSKLNFDDDLPLAEKAAKEGPQQIKMPALFISATRDGALPPSMSAGMEKFFENLTRGEVQSSHWALIEASEQVNRQIAKWADGVLSGTSKSLL